jgi:hypothetical protein
MSTSPKSKQERRRDRREERRLKREAELRAARQRRTLLISGVVALVVIIAGVAFFSLRGALANGGQSNASSTPAAVSVDSTATAIASMPPVGLSSIQCNSMEQLTYHVHAHVSIYINGQPATIPANVGIDQTQGCFYWLHTHDTSGVIHVEAPGPSNFVLGTFFDEWKQKFSQLGYPQQLDQAGWTAYVNGKQYNGDFRNISLISHTLITLMYHSPNAKPDTVYNWDGL